MKGEDEWKCHQEENDATPTGPCGDLSVSPLLVSPWSTRVFSGFSPHKAAADSQAEPPDLCHQVSRRRSSCLLDLFLREEPGNGNISMNKAMT